MTNSADPDQLASSKANWSGSTLFAKAGYQGSGNFEIWIGPADYVINEPISKKKCVYHLSRKLMTIGSPMTPFK